jgi:ATP-binding cassette subfamily C exporter for protease/lipase
MPNVEAATITTRSPNPLRAALVPFRKELVAVGIFSLVVNLMLLTPTLYMLQVYDRVMISQSGFTLLALSAVALFFYVVMTFSDWMRSRILVRAGVRFDEALNSRVFNASFDRSLNQKAKVTQEAFTDLTNLRQFITGAGVFAFFDIPWIPLYLAVVWLLHPWLVAIALVFVLMFGVLAWIGHHLTYQATEQNMDARRQAGQFVFSKLRNSEAVESMGMLEGIRKRWMSLHEVEMDAQHRLLQMNERVQAVMKFVQYSQQSLMLGAAAWLVILGKLSMGSMIAANVMMQRCVQPVQMMVSTWRLFMSAVISYRRLNQLLEEHPQRDSLALPQDFRARLSIVDLCATAAGRQTPILRNVNLEFRPGELTVVLGPSGSGKSTLARCLLGIWPEFSGQVLLDGLPMEQIDRQSLGARIGYMPQDVEMLDGSIADNIARFGSVDPAQVVAAAQAAGIHELVLQFPQGYDFPMGLAGSVLSGGQRQRVALARALYGDPQLIILDEPNANLDEFGEAAMMQALVRLKAAGRTVVVISHRGGVLNVADRLVVLAEGQVLAAGPRQEVIDRLSRRPNPNPEPNPRPAAVAA